MERFSTRLLITGPTRLRALLMLHKMDSVWHSLLGSALIGLRTIFTVAQRADCKRTRRELYSISTYLRWGYKTPGFSLNLLLSSHPDTLRTWPSPSTWILLKVSGSFVFLLGPKPHLDLRG